MNSKALNYSGTYFDGRSTRKQPVKISLTPRDLHITLGGGAEFRWPYSSLQLVPVAGANQPIQLDHPARNPDGSKRVEFLVIEDRSILEAIQSMAPDSLEPSFKRNFRLSWTWMAAGVVPALLLIVVLWKVVVPGFSEAVADWVPVSVEEALGEKVLNQIFPGGPPESDEELKNALDAMAQRLLATQPEQPYTFQIYILDSEIVNALALPGGKIILFQGLLNASESPEEVAGVLAHEFQHVIRRHATRGIIRNLAVGVLLSLIVGDASGIQALAQLADQLEGLRYSREIETEADEHGLKMILAAGIDPNGMVTMFEKFKKEEAKRWGNSGAGSQKGGGPPEWMEYLSTHPAMDERVARLRRRSETQFAQTPTPLLPNRDWKQVAHRSNKTNPNP